jgi:cytochrome-b5 reductase
MTSRAMVDGKPIMRAYTPVSMTDAKGHFDLAIKVYSKGQMSQHIAKLSIGDTLDIRGPRGSFVHTFEPLSTAYILCYYNFGSQ